MPAKVHNLKQHKNAPFKTIVHNVGVGLSTKWTEIGLCERAIKKKNCFFQNHKSHIFLHVYIDFPRSWISRNFLEFVHFPEITRKESGFPGIWEISFKVETLLTLDLNNLHLDRGHDSTEDSSPVWDCCTLPYRQGSILALARLPRASKIPCRASKISKYSNLLAQSGK